MSADNPSDAPTTEQKGKENAPIDEPVQEDRFSLRDSTYGTGAAHPTPTTPLFPPPQEQNRQHQGVLTVVEEDEKLEHFPVEDASSRHSPTTLDPSVEGEAAVPHESVEVRSADVVDDNKSIATNPWAAPGGTTTFRPIDWRRQRSPGPDAQRAAADREISPMRLSGEGSAETRASHQATDEDVDMPDSSDAIDALSGHSEAPTDHGDGGSTRLSVQDESSPSLKRSSDTLSSSPCQRNRSSRAGPSRRPPQRAPRQGATEHVWSGPEECLPNLQDATDPQSLYGIEDPFADNDNASDPHPRFDSSNRRSVAAHQHSVAMSDPQSLLSALNATPRTVRRSRSNAAFTRLSVTHSEIVRARSEERQKGLQENEIPAKARAKLGIQAPVRQVPNPADPTSHLPPAFAGQNALGSWQGNTGLRIEIPRRFKPPSPAEVAARGRRRIAPDSEIPPVTETAILHETPRESSRSSRKVERWVLGENHPADFHEDDEEQGLLQDMHDGTRDELQPFATREGYVNPASEPPTSDEEKKKRKKQKEKERKKRFWANCRRGAAKKLLRRKKKDDKDKKP